LFIDFVITSAREALVSIHVGRLNATTRAPPTFQKKGWEIVRRLGLILGTAFVLVVILFSVWIISRPERGTTGAVSTKFRLLGPNDKSVIDGFEDPKVDGVACHISRAQTGGMKGAFGVAEDTSDASIACRQIGPIKIKGEI